VISEARSIRSEARFNATEASFVKVSWSPACPPCTARGGIPHRNTQFRDACKFAAPGFNTAETRPHARRLPAIVAPELFPFGFCTAILLRARIFMVRDQPFESPFPRCMAFRK